MVGAEALAEAYRIVGSDPLYEAAGRSLGAAYKVWSHEKPKRVPDKRVCNAAHAQSVMRGLLSWCHVPVRSHASATAGACPPPCLELGAAGSQWFRMLFGPDSDWCPSDAEPWREAEDL